MKYKVTIGIVMVVMMMLLTGAVNKIEMGPASYDEQITMTKSYVEIKCDPCDYNIDYGDTDHLAEKAGVDEGVAKLKCDPCDYNIDYGDTE
jgi:Zn finger protein HypA/HybF involved in hydrogenase expression